jgi:FlaA1/EpsC-like NDP-sugar epimerase
MTAMDGSHSHGDPIQQRKWPMADTVSPSWPDSQEFWCNKRVIVTGGAGFLGSD